MPSCKCEGMAISQSDALLLDRAYRYMSRVMGFPNGEPWDVLWHGMAYPCVHADISGMSALVECLEGYRDFSVAQGESVLAVMGFVRHSKRFISALIDA